MITFTCGRCGVGLRVADEQAGKKGKCLKCGEPFVVSTPAAPAVGGFNSTSPTSVAPAKELASETAHVVAPKLSRRLLLVLVACGGMAALAFIVVAVVGGWQNKPEGPASGHPETNAWLTYQIPSGSPMGTALDTSILPQTASSLKPGATWLHERTGNTMVFVPSAVIVPATQNPFGADSSLQQHGKTVGALISIKDNPLFVTGFYMDKDEVTNRAYQRYLNATGRKPPRSWPDGTLPKGREDFPVTVTWEAADAYAQWAGLRLPELYEYYAATANKDGKYPWTKVLDWTRKLNVREGQTDSPVGGNARDVSPYGIQDLIGHALEWVDGEVSVPAEGLQLRGRGLFFLYEFNHQDPKDTWLVSISIPKEDLPAAGFRCCYTPVFQVLSKAKTIKYDFSKAKAFDEKVVIVQVANESGRTIRFLSSNGIDETIKQNGTAELSFLAGTYLMTAPEVGQPSASEIRFEMITRPRLGSWGMLYGTITISDRGLTPLMAK